MNQSNEILLFSSFYCMPKNQNYHAQRDNNENKHVSFHRATQNK